MATSLIVRHFPTIDTVTFSSRQTNYVFVLPLLHRHHRCYRLFIGPLDSTGKGFAFTAVSVQHALCDNSQYSYAINDPMPSVLILSAFASGLSFRSSCFRSCLLSFFSLSVDLPLSWAFFPWHQYRSPVTEKMKSTIFKNFFWLIFTIYKTTRARLNSYNITN